jgi:hypothetical protein
MVRRGIVIPDYEEVIKAPQVEIQEGGGLQTEDVGTNNILEKK